MLSWLDTLLKALYRAHGIRVWTSCFLAYSRRPLVANKAYSLDHQVHRIRCKGGCEMASVHLVVLVTWSFWHPTALVTGYYVSVRMSAVFECEEGRDKRKSGKMIVSEAPKKLSAIII